MSTNIHKTLLVGLLLLAVAVTIQNTEPVTFHLIVIDITMPQIIYTILVMLLGYSIGRLSHNFWGWPKAGRESETHEVHR